MVAIRGGDGKGRNCGFLCKSLDQPEAPRNGCAETNSGMGHSCHAGPIRVPCPIWERRRSHPDIRGNRRLPQAIGIGEGGDPIGRRLERLDAVGVGVGVAARFDV